MGKGETREKKKQEENGENKERREKKKKHRKGRNQTNNKKKWKRERQWNNGIPNKAWNYGGKRLEETIIKYIEDRWNGEKIPEEWKWGQIKSIYKKRYKGDPQNCRGIMLIKTIYICRVVERKADKRYGGKRSYGKNAI